jgi:hypothetical protein
MSNSNPLLRRSQPLPIENPYSRYGLKENPFPDSPTVTPESSDPRVNGEIYCRDLRIQEEAQFERLLVSKLEQSEPRRIALLMDYATRRGRGIGKTAFLNEQRRRIMTDLGYRLTGGAYVLMAAHVVPESGGRTRKFWQFIRLLARSLGSSRCIAHAIWRLRAFSGEIPDDILLQIDPDDLGATLGNDAWLQNRGVKILFGLNSSVERRLVHSGVRPYIAKLLAESGHDLETWEQRFIVQKSDHWWRTEGDVFVFDDLIKLFRAAEVNRVILLVDEVEKIVVPQNRNERQVFTDDLRRYLVDGPYQSVYHGFYSLLLTIHPYIQELWSSYWQASGLDRVCAISGHAAKEFTIYFYPLEASDAAVPLVLAYLNFYRILPEKKDTLEPFDDQAVVEALQVVGGVPGPMLTLLRLALQRAVNEGWNSITSDKVRAIYESEVPSEPSNEDEFEQLPSAQIDLREETSE